MPGQIYDRVTGRTCPESQYGATGLEFLYGNPVGRLLLRVVATRPMFSELATWRWRSLRSAAGIDDFCRRFGVDVYHYVKPEGGWASFADFFTRDFADGARPLAQNPAALVSPADGLLTVVPIEAGTLVLKGMSYTLAGLIGDEAVAALFTGGTALVVRLTVADAHTYVYPTSGRVVRRGRLGGLLHTVGPAGDAPFLMTNRRAWELADTPLGPMLTVEVGAMLVGRIVNTGPTRFERGQRKGHFEPGGSTIVVLLAADAVRIDDDLLAASARGLETRVRACEQVGVRHDR